MMHCSKCGSNNEDAAKFCGVCGEEMIELGTAAVGVSRPTFINSIKYGFQNYANFKGRATRAEYWWWALFIYASFFVLSIVDGFAGTILLEDRGLFSTLFQLAILIPSLSLGARRLHDIDKSGWWLLLLFAALIGWIFLIWWAIKQGNRWQNQYGPDPRTE
tara:strand:+ start:1192 stop:1674 length:483 start_codon:yes stop_codon:yes gene_type:complete